MISKYPVFYITPDPLRAVGLERLFDNFHIICYDDKPLVDFIDDSGVKIFSFAREVGETQGFIRNAGKMLEHPKVQNYIKIHSDGKRPAILFFKPSYKIDIVCEHKDYLKIGNDADLNRIFEDKLEFYKLCLKKSWPVPKGTIGKVKDFNFEDLISRFGIPFVVQFGRGWAGSTTFFINRKKQWKTFYKKWSEKEVKISEKIKGKTFLNNACVFGKNVLVSSPAIQLHPIKGLLGGSSSTFGRQWPSRLTKEQINKIYLLTQEIGKVMGITGYKGWFGLDFIVDEKSGDIFVSENNARLTASASFYTQTELSLGQDKPMFYYHASQFLETNIINDWKSLNTEASQFVYRNFTSTKKTVRETVKSGIYSINNKFLRDGSGIVELMGPGEIFLSCPAAGEEINPGVEMFTIECKCKILDEKGQYLSWFSDFVKKTIDSIILY